MLQIDSVDIFAGKAGKSEKTYRPETLLIVEEDAAFAELFMFILEKRGYTVERISGIEELPGKLETMRPNTVLANIPKERLIKWI